MLRGGVVVALVLVALAGVAHGQPATSFPSVLHGLVHRTTGLGCGQSFTVGEALSSVTLTTRGRRAELVVDGRWREEHGGRGLTVGGVTGPRTHTVTDHRARVVWSGRARRETGRLMIALHALSETRDVEGTSVVVTSRSELDAELDCQHETYDVFAADRPASVAGELPLETQRDLVACRFAMASPEPPLPRPVVDVLTWPLLLDAGAGITTDATYGIAVSTEPGSLVARRPGGFATALAAVPSP